MHKTEQNKTKQNKTKQNKTTERLHSATLVARARGEKREERGEKDGH